MIAKGEVDVNEARERLEKVVGKENVDALADAYAYAYAGTTLTPAQAHLKGENELQATEVEIVRAAVRIGKTSN